MIYVNIALLTGLLISGIVCLIKLCWLILLTVLSLVWINYGRIRILYMIFELKLKEQETEVRFSW